MKAAACAAAAGLCAGLAQSAPDTFDNYLVDVGPGHVSAGEMLKVSSSAITPIESPKDIVALLNFAGTDEGRKGFGLAVTPARTSLVPLAVQTYLDNPWARLWGGTTFSYAQDRQSLQGTEYRRQALAVNVSYYLDKQEDPHVIARQAFIGCQKQLQPRMAAETARIMALVQGLPPEQVAAAVERIKSEPQRFLPEANAIVRQCFQAAGKPTWNATQFALSAGQAWIRPPGSGGERLSPARAPAPPGAGATAPRRGCWPSTSRDLGHPRLRHRLAAAQRHPAPQRPSARPEHAGRDTALRPLDDRRRASHLRPRRCPRPVRAGRGEQCPVVQDHAAGCRLQVRARHRQADRRRHLGRVPRRAPAQHRRRP